MDKLSEELRDRVANRLAGEFSDISKRIKVDYPAVGDAIAVVLDEKFSSEHAIGRMGRMYLTEDKPRLKVAPLAIDREPKYEVDDRTCVEWGSSFTHDKKTFFEPSQLVRDVRWPRSLMTSGMNRRKVERSLFVHMARHSSEKIVLVNPSISSINSLSKTVGGFVTVTNREDPEFAQAIKDVILNLEVPNVSWINPESAKGMLTYLGSGQPKEFIGNWFRLIPSPFYFEMKKSTTVFGSPGNREWLMRETRSESRVISYTWGESDPFFSYNTKSVSATLGTMGDWIFQSKMDWSFKDEEDTRVLSTPIYLASSRLKDDTLGDLLVKVSVDNPLIVYDVKGPGTYLSRRARIELPVGYCWAKFVLHVTEHYVTSLSNGIIEDMSVSFLYQGGSEFLCLDHASPLVDLTPIKVNPGPAGTVLQEYPLILSPGGDEMNLWQGRALFNHWQGSKWRTVLFSTPPEVGAYAFRHDSKTINRELIGNPIRTIKFTAGGSSYIYIGTFTPTHSWTLLPSELDMYMVQSLTRFFSLGVPAIDVSSLGFKGARAVPLVSAISQFVITKWGQPGLSYRDIQLLLPDTSYSGIVSSVAISRDVLSLDGGTFCLLSNFQIPFRGDRKEGFWDGRMVGELLFSVSSSEHLICSFVLYPEDSFFQLCKGNGIIFKHRPTETGHIFVFKWPRFYSNTPHSNRKGADSILNQIVV